VRRISDTRFELDRSMLESVLSNPSAVSRAARVVPSIAPRDGRPNGFKLYAIRPDSVYSVIGLQNGDTLSAINGQTLDNPAKAFELYAKLRTASSLQLSVIRRGQPMTLDYSIRWTAPVPRPSGRQHAPGPRSGVVSGRRRVRRARPAPSSGPDAPPAPRHCPA
jgi:hypothetical protein